MTDQEAYNQLALYTLAKNDGFFIHQYIVDAYAAQHAEKETKKITLTFALVGLYLHLEKNYSGRQVQLAHMRLAQFRKDWPKFELPEDRGKITVYEVLETKEGEARDKMINMWCASVWKAWEGSRKEIADLLKAELNI